MPRINDLVDSTAAAWSLVGGLGLDVFKQLQRECNMTSCLLPQPTDSYPACNLPPCG